MDDLISSVEFVSMTAATKHFELQKWKGISIHFKWINEIFSTSLDDGDKEFLQWNKSIMIKFYVRADILYLFNGLLFTDLTVRYVPLLYLMLLESFDVIWTPYTEERLVVVLAFYTSRIGIRTIMVQLVYFEMIELYCLDGVIFLHLDICNANNMLNGFNITSIIKSFMVNFLLQKGLKVASYLYGTNK
uniref:Uncharacterized protein n=1 Tax=Salix viminalis TaxID=40686 RepID=A0A6N2LNF0_SALVM